MTIDGADEIDQKLNAIKGGGACLFQERLVAQASRRFVLVAGTLYTHIYLIYSYINFIFYTDDRKKSDQLGTKVSNEAFVLDIIANCNQYSGQEVSL